MMKTTHAIGWKAKDFALQGIDGRTYSLADIRGPKGTLVVFICNHCPYVKASINRIVTEANALREIGIGTIAIMPNDTESYPEDSFDNMKDFLPRGTVSAFPMSLTRVRKWRELMALNAHRTSSALTQKTSCNTEVGSMPRV